MRKTVYNLQTGESTSVDLTDEEVIEFEKVKQPKKTPDLSFAQLIHGLHASAWITEEEAYAWASGTLPTSVQAVISQLPQKDRLLATVRAVRPTYIARNDDFVKLLSASQGRTDDEMDDFFSTYSKV